MSIDSNNFKASSDPANFKSFIGEARKLLYISRANLFSGLSPFAEKCTDLHPELLSQIFKTGEPILHHHDHFKLMYITESGHGTHIVDKKRIPLNSGEIIIIPPAMNHMIEATGIEVSCTPGYLVKSFGGKAANLFFDWAYLRPWLLKKNECLTVKPDEAAQQPLRAAFDALISAENKLRPESYSHSSLSLDEYIAHFENCVKVLFDLLCNIFYSDFSPRETHTFSKYRAPLIAAVSYIDDNFSRKITIDDLCRHSGLKSSRLSQLFQEIIGLTIGDYIKFIRCQKARRLLVNTNLPFGEIGLRTGFNSAAYFTHVFKQFTGCIPKFYRNEFAIEWKD